MAQKADFSNYYLDLDKLFKLDDSDKARIYNMYTDMLHHNNDGRYEVSNSLFCTLENSGFIRNNIAERREQKFSEVLDGQV